MTEKTNPASLSYNVSHFWFKSYAKDFQHFRNFLADLGDFPN